VSQTLACVIGSAESKRSDAPKDELYPGGDGNSLANEAMCLDYNLSHFRMYALLQVKFQVDAHGDLRKQHEHDVRDELGVDILRELSSLMLMTEEVSCDSEDGAEGLY